jgi:Zn-dependent protease/predicted transcriptional regulator
MFTDSITIGRLFGIRLAVSLSWFLLFGLVTLSLGSVYFPSQYPRWPPLLYWAAGLVASLLFFACVLAHELAHSLVALSKKVPVRSITLFIFGGVSHIGKDAPSPGVEFAIALAGPLTSFGLALVAAALHFLTRGHNEPLNALFGWLAWVNASLGLFNLLPGFPLDGGRVLRAIVWFAADDFPWATRVATRAGQLAAVTMMLAGGYIVFAQEAATSSGYGFWLMFVGWFLFSAAGGTYQTMLVLQALAGVLVRDVMRPEPDLVDSETAVRDLVDSRLADPRREPLVVVRNGAPVGLIGHSSVRRLKPDRLATVRVNEAMRALDASLVLEDDSPAGQALQALIESGNDSLPVVREGQVVGLIRREDLFRQVGLRRRLFR